MQKDKKNLNNRYGDETPSLHDFLMVIVIMAVLIVCLSLLSAVVCYSTSSSITASRRESSARALGCIR